MDWKYKGKFVDRTPNLRAAGASLAKCDELKDCLEIYPIDDAIETVLTEAGLHKVPAKSPPQKLSNSRHPGTFTQARSVLQPPVETSYQTLLRDLRETKWESYWNKGLGTNRDPVGALPPRVTADFSFGIPHCADHPSGEELINPPVTPYERVFNDAEYHEMYRKTHHDYFPGEKVSRNYGPPFNPHVRYGSIPKRGPDASGLFAMKNSQSVAMANDILADNIHRTHYRLGKSLAPNDNIHCVEPGHRFGIKSVREFYSLPELLQPKAENENFRKDFRTWLTSLVEIRKMYKKRNADFKELYGYCKYADTNDNDWIPINVFQKILLDRKLSFPLYEILPLAQCFGIYKDGMVHYSSMLDFFNVSVDLPNLMRIDENCDRSKEFVTTYQFERCDSLIKDVSKYPAAGIPCFREDVNTVVVGTEGLRTDRENLGNETTVSALLNPSIYTNYGLSQIDLLAPRKPEFLRTLYERLGYQFPDDTFEKLWQIGQQVDNNKYVCADTFKQVMEQAAPITINDEPEDKCFDKEPEIPCHDK